MANTTALVTSTPYRLVYLLTGDGTVTSPILTSATAITNSTAGPLRDALSASYASQALMQAAFLRGNPVRTTITLRNAVNDVTAEQNIPTVDVDTDAVTVTRPEFNITMSDTTGQIAYLEIEYIHSIPR